MPPWNLSTGHSVGKPRRVPRWTHIAVTLTLIAASACIPLSRGRLYASKHVAAKQGANQLVALDGATCPVASDTFQRVRIGDQHRCVWTPVTLQAPPPRTPPPARARAF